MDMITQFITHYKESFMEELNIENEQEVNSGFCVEFAEFIEHELRLQGIEDVERISNDCLMDEEDDPMNSTNIHHFHVPVLQTYNLTKEQLNTYKQHLHSAGTNAVGYHMWLYSHQTKKHYDIEIPTGVENAFELPFFQRQYQNKSN